MGSRRLAHGRPATVAVLAFAFFCLLKSNNVELHYYFQINPARSDCFYATDQSRHGQLHVREQEYPARVDYIIY
jgi:hypothetical protein